jgi:uncharacterized protein (TIGR00730 family)
MPFCSTSNGVSRTRLACGPMPALHRLCVYAGSNPGNRPQYAAAAADLARLMAARGIGLVYGGGKVGLMGVLADTILAEGGEAIGVIPQALLDREVGHTGLTELRVVGSMHERKALMAELADGFVAVPGGIGTLEELIEVFTWSQLGIHAKPCAMLDAEGFYSGLAGLLDHMVAEGFLRAEHRAGLLSDPEPGPLLERMEAWRPPSVHTWVELERS